MSAISRAPARFPDPKRVSAAVCLRFPGTARSPRSWQAESHGRFWKTAIRYRCAAGARAMDIALALVRLRARSCRPRQSFRGDTKYRTRNLEIPGLVLVHHPGMTAYCIIAAQEEYPECALNARRGRRRYI